MLTLNVYSVHLGLLLIFMKMVWCQKLLFNFDLTPDMETSDFDIPSSDLSKLIKYVVKGQTEMPSEYLSIQVGPDLIELGIEIKNSSVFVPGDDVKNSQFGFRRTDVLPAIDITTALVGTTVFHQTFRTNSQLPLNLDHGYLLASIEIPSGDHVFDIYTGSDFNSDLAAAPTSNSRTIRVRDLKTNVLYSIPLIDDSYYNFAVAVDWDENTLSVYASEGDDDLQLVAGPVSNDPKVVAAENVQKGEWHVQLIKFPLPNPADTVDRRGDVPHLGLQEGTHEGVFFSRMYVEEGSGGKVTTYIECGVCSQAK